MTAATHELIDATGGGCCELRPDGTIESASPGFVALSGAADPRGRRPSEVLAELPPLAELPASVEAETPVFRHVGVDGIGREIAAALVGSPGVLILVDRSGEARLRRSEARLGRQIDDLKAELAARERAPRKPRVRSLAEFAQRLDEALARARRYNHDVTIVSIQIANLDALGEGAPGISDLIVSCVRGVDDVARPDAAHWILGLPHTPLAGAEVVAKRVQDRLTAIGVERIGVGVAQVGAEEPGSEAVSRADQAGSQALERGGGLLLAVALM